MNQYGSLLTPDIKLHRLYFNEMVKLLGIQVIYRAPKPNKSYTTYSEIESNYEKPILLGCIFDDHPNQKTMKKLGWVSELQDNASIIHIPYDTPGIQKGALFIVPSGIDNTQGRLFRLTDMMVSVVYPSAITCTIVPEYDSVYNDANNDFTKQSFTVLNVDESEDHL